jgi:hypothetical protein
MYRISLPLSGTLGPSRLYGACPDAAIYCTFTSPATISGAPCSITCYSLKIHSFVQKPVLAELHFPASGMTSQSPDHLSNCTVSELVFSALRVANVPLCCSRDMAPGQDITGLRSYVDYGRSHQSPGQHQHCQGIFIAAISKSFCFSIAL